jgi:hypothetical protein
MPKRRSRPLPDSQNLYFNVKLAQRISVPLSRKRERACPGLDPGAGVREAVTAHDSFMLQDGKFAMTVSMRKLAIVT